MLGCPQPNGRKDLPHVGLQASGPSFLFFKKLFIYSFFFFLVRLNALLVFGHVQLVKDKN